MICKGCPKTNCLNGYFGTLCVHLYICNVDWKIIKSLFTGHLLSRSISSTEQDKDIGDIEVCDDNTDLDDNTDDVSECDDRQV